MDTNAPNSLSNRREYFRVDDAVELSYYAVPAGMAAHTISEDLIKQHLFANETDYLHFQLMQQLNEVNATTENLLHNLNRDTPELGEYLQRQDQKLQMIAHYTYKAFERPTQRVNLSAGGIAFFAPQEFQEGERLKIKLILRPNFIGIICSAVVVRTVHLPGVQPDKPYRISVKFLDLEENDLKNLHKHIFQLQIRQRKDKDPW